jgi:hypothetical protein
VVSPADAKRGASIDDAGRLVPTSGSDAPAVLSDEEKKVLDLLVSCGAARTPAQLAAGCGLEREQAAQALDGLRAKGLVTPLNTLVESYIARFPGIEV